MVDLTKIDQIDDEAQLQKMVNNILKYFSICLSLISKFKIFLKNNIDTFNLKLKLKYLADNV